MSSPSIFPDDGKQDMAQTSSNSDIEQLVQPIDVTIRDYRMTDPVGLSLATVEIGGSEEQLKGNDGFGDGIHSEVAVSYGCGDLHSSFEKPVGGKTKGIFTSLLLLFFHYMLTICVLCRVQTCLLV